MSDIENEIIEGECESVELVEVVESNAGECYECDNFAYCSFTRSLIPVINDHIHMIENGNIVISVTSPIFEIIAKKCKFFRKITYIID